MEGVQYEMLFRKRMGEGCESSSWEVWWIWQSLFTVSWYSLEKNLVSKKETFLKWLFPGTKILFLGFRKSRYYLRAHYFHLHVFCLAQGPSSGDRSVPRKGHAGWLMFKNGRRVMFWSVNVILSFGYLSRNHSLGISLKGVVSPTHIPFYSPSLPRLSDA